MKNFITIEGCDGVGKTYQTRLLKEYCNEVGANVIFTREPGGSDIAEQIRRIILDAKNSSMFGHVRGVFVRRFTHTAPSRHCQTCPRRGKNRFFATGTCILPTSIRVWEEDSVWKIL